MKQITPHCISVGSCNCNCLFENFHLNFMKLYRTLFEHFQGVFLLSVGFMGIMSFGTFDPTDVRFYICIGIAIFTHYMTRGLLRRFRNDEKKNSASAKTARIIFSLTFLSVAFMVFMSFGTFNPTKAGFYVCIAIACFIEFSIRWFLKKHLQPPTS